MSRIRGGAWDGAKSYLYGYRNLKPHRNLKRSFLGFRVVQDRVPIVIKCGALDNFDGCLNNARHGNAFAKDREHFLTSRGGSWDLDTGGLRSADYDANDPNTYEDYQGFRVVER